MRRHRGNLGHHGRRKQGAAASGTGAAERGAEPMTTFNLTCEAVEATLPDYLDETLEGWVRISIEEHLGECVRCAGLARELRNITREASAMPALVPKREIWPRIAGRIGVPVSVSEPVAENE